MTPTLHRIQIMGVARIYNLGSWCVSDSVAICQCICSLIYFPISCLLKILQFLDWGAPGQGYTAATPMSKSNTKHCLQFNMAPTFIRGQKYLNDLINTYFQLR